MNARGLVDQEFIKKAERINKDINTLNISLRDYTIEEKRKTEIQLLIQKYHFPEFNISTKALNTFDINKLNGLINELKNKYRQDFLKIYQYRPEGIGPGEILLYFLVNIAFLSGRSKSTDIVINDKLYEVKAAKITADRKRAYGFFLGGTVSFSGIIEELKALNERYNLGGTSTNIGVTIINKMREEYPDEFNPIENKFKKIAFEDYFQGDKTEKKNVIFFNNNDSSKGLIQVIKTVSKEDLTIEQYTSNSIKPYIIIA